jgi:hypothetical protein
MIFVCDGWAGLEPEAQRQGLAWYRVDRLNPQAEADLMGSSNDLF